MQISNPCNLFEQKCPAEGINGIIIFGNVRDGQNNVHSQMTDYHGNITYALTSLPAGKGCISFVEFDGTQSLRVQRNIRVATERGNGGTEMQGTAATSPTSMKLALM